MSEELMLSSICILVFGADDFLVHDSIYEKTDINTRNTNQYFKGLLAVDILNQF
jgi:hypothetical protein